MPCLACGDCCREVAFPIEPTLGNAIWAGLHGGKLGLEGGKWHVFFPLACRELGEDGHCSIYATRPDTCRVYLCADAQKGG